MGATRIEKIEIEVANRQEAENFYQKVLGLTLKAREKRRSILALEDGIQVILVDSDTTGMPVGTLGVRRLVFQVPSVYEVSDQLDAIGFRHLGPDDASDRPAVGFRDPNGVALLASQPRETWGRGGGGGASGFAETAAGALGQSAPTTPPALTPPPVRSTGTGLVSDSTLAASPKAAAPPKPSPADEARTKRARDSALAFLEHLKKDIRQVQSILIGQALGQLAIHDNDRKYKDAYSKVTDEIETLKARGGAVANNNPHESLLSFFRHWSRHLPSRDKKEQYVCDLYGDVLEFIDKVRGGLNRGESLGAYFTNAEEAFVYKGDIGLSAENPLG